MVAALPPTQLQVYPTTLSLSRYLVHGVVIQRTGRVEENPGAIQAGVVIQRFMRRLLLRSRQYYQKPPLHSLMARTAVSCPWHRLFISSPPSGKVVSRHVHKNRHPIRNVFFRTTFSSRVYHGTPILFWHAQRRLEHAMVSSGRRPPPARRTAVFWRNVTGVTLSF